MTLVHAYRRFVRQQSARHCGKCVKPIRRGSELFISGLALCQRCHALAIEARRAATTSGAVHKSAGRNGNAQQGDA